MPGGRSCRGENFVTAGPPVGTTLQERFEDRLARDGDGRALAFYKPGAQVEWRTFAQLHAESLTVAGGLAKRGLKPGDVCLIVLPSGEQAVLTLMAALLLGARPLLMAPPALLGMNSDLPRVLAYAVERTGASLVILPASQGDQPELYAGLGRGRTTLAYADEDFTDGGDGPASLAASYAPDDVAALQLTSGTTGLPKICVWSQRAVLEALDGMTAAMELTPGDVCFNWTPLYHDMGLVNNFLTCVSGGIPLVLMDPHDFIKRPSDWLRGLDETGATVTWAPNFGFALVTERTDPAAVSGIRLDAVRGFWNAAERIHARTYSGFAETFAHIGLRPDALRTNFGCAENIGGATFTVPGETYAVEYVDAVRFRDEGRAVTVDQDHPNSIVIVGAGKGHPKLEVVILDDDVSPLPDGVVGAVALRTPSRMEGYLGDEEATAEAIVGDLLLTGDLGYLRTGELFWVGRAHERITVRGKKIDPSDFEPILVDVEGLRQGCFAAFGVDDPDTGTEAVVIVSEIRNPGDDGHDVIIEQIRRRVFAGMGVRVADVLLVAPGTLTKTSSGKRRHRHFKKMYEAGSLDAVSVSRSA